MRTGNSSGATTSTKSVGSAGIITTTTSRLQKRASKPHRPLPSRQRACARHSGFAPILSRHSLLSYLVSCAGPPHPPLAPSFYENPDAQGIAPDQSRRWTLGDGDCRRREMTRTPQRLGLLMRLILATVNARKLRAASADDRQGCLVRIGTRKFSDASRAATLR